VAVAGRGHDDARAASTSHLAPQQQQQRAAAAKASPHDGVELRHVGANPNLGVGHLTPDARRPLPRPRPGGGGASSGSGGQDGD
jgi:hypothetical protein